MDFIIHFEDKLMDKRIITGWGQTCPGETVVKEISLNEKFEFANKYIRYIPRGKGRSYGDAAQVSGGITLQTSQINDFRVVDDILETAAGTSLFKILNYIIPMGFFIPVVPGTQFVSIGGAIASDIHGKNHHNQGSFETTVMEMEIITPTGEFLCSRTKNSDLFWATIGGMGLTGLITKAKIKLNKIETSKILVDSVRIKNLDMLISEMEENDKNYEYSVAWIDTLSKRKNFGRSILIFGNHATSEDLANFKKQNILSYKPKKGITLPVKVPFNFINRFTVKIFNEIWYQKHFPKNKKTLKDISNFFFPLDSLKNWNKLYGPKGFIQYQVVLPITHKHLISEIIEIFSRKRCPIFLAVLKRMGKENLGHLSFPFAGWTLALDSQDCTKFSTR